MCILKKAIGMGSRKRGGTGERDRIPVEHNDRRRESKASSPCPCCKSTKRQGMKGAWQRGNSKWKPVGRLKLVFSPLSSPLLLLMLDPLAGLVLLSSSFRCCTPRRAGAAPRLSLYFAVYKYVCSIPWPTVGAPIQSWKWNATNISFWVLRFIAKCLFSAQREEKKETGDGASIIIIPSASLFENRITFPLPRCLRTLQYVVTVARGLWYLRVWMCLYFFLLFLSHGSMIVDLSCFE